MKINARLNQSEYLIPTLEDSELVTIGQIKDTLINSVVLFNFVFQTMNGANNFFASNPVNQGDTMFIIEDNQVWRYGGASKPPAPYDPTAWVEVPLTDIVSNPVRYVTEAEYLAAKGGSADPFAIGTLYVITDTTPNYAVIYDSQLYYEIGNIQVPTGLIPKISSEDEALTYVIPGTQTINLLDYLKDNITQPTVKMWEGTEINHLGGIISANAIFDLNDGLPEGTNLIMRWQSGTYADYILLEGDDTELPDQASFPANSIIWNQITTSLNNGENIFLFVTSDGINPDPAYHITSETGSVTASSYVDPASEGLKFVGSFAQQGITLYFVDKTGVSTPIFTQSSIPIDPADLISEDADNKIELGSDGFLFTGSEIDPNAVEGEFATIDNGLITTLGITPDDVIVYKGEFSINSGDVSSLVDGPGLYKINITSTAVGSNPIYGVSPVTFWMLVQLPTFSMSSAIAWTQDYPYSTGPRFWLGEVWDNNILWNELATQIKVDQMNAFRTVNGWTFNATTPQTYNLVDDNNNIMGSITFNAGGAGATTVMTWSPDPTPGFEIGHLKASISGNGGSFYTVIEETVQPSLGAINIPNMGAGQYSIEFTAVGEDGKNYRWEITGSWGITSNSTIFMARTL